MPLWKKHEEKKHLSYLALTDASLVSYYRCSHTRYKFSLPNKKEDVIVNHPPQAKPYGLRFFMLSALIFSTRKTKDFLSSLSGIQALSIFQCNIRCENQFILRIFRHTICLLPKDFFNAS